VNAGSSDSVRGRPEAAGSRFLGSCRCSRPCSAERPWG